MLNLIKTKIITATILLICIPLLFMYSLSTPQQVERFTQVSGVSISVMLAVVCLGVLCSPFIFVFESHIHAELKRSGTVKYLGLLLYVAIYIFLLLRLTPDQIERINKNNFIFWASLVCWTIFSSVLICISSSYNNTQETTLRHVIISGIFLGLILVSMSVVYVTSSSHYMILDLPDEPWVASMAISFLKEQQLDQTLIALKYNPLFWHYYKWMALWLKYVGASFANMRLFSVIIAFASTLTLGTALFIHWRKSSLIAIPIGIVGMIFVLIHPTFLRMSHNLRPDIVMALHSSLLVLSLLVFEHTHKKIYLIVAGISLYVGLESIIYPSILVSCLFGVGLIWDWATRPDRAKFQIILYYLSGNLIALGLYILLHYFPNVRENLMITPQFTNRYTSRFSLTPLPILFYHIPFYNAISPLYASMMFIGLIIAGYVEKGLVRRVAIITIVTIAILFTTSITAVGYTAIIAPLVAFSIAGLVRYRSILFIVTIIIIPISATILIRDLNWTIQRKINQRTFDELRLIDWRIPQGSKVLVDDPTFFLVYSHKADILWRESLNLSSYAINHPNATEAEVFHALGINHIICEDGTKLCDLAEQMFSNDPIEFRTTRQIYWFY